MLPKRYRFIEVGLMLAAIAAMLMPILTYSAQSPAAYLPIVANKTNAQATSFTTLIDHDTTFVNAANIPGTCRVIVTYIDRANGNRLHVTEDMFNRLVEISMTVEMRLAIGADYLDPQPQFEYPGPKHASGFPIIVCNELWVYANARDVGDLTGPFKLKRLTMPIPPKPTN
jgi:hypothetical protein